MSDRDRNRKLEMSIERPQ